MSLVTVRAIYVGADKQHWAQLASQTALAGEFNRPVSVYPTYAATLIDVYQPTVLRLSGARPPSGMLSRVIPDGADAPAFDGDAVWLVYIEAPGIEHIRQQSTERGYERVNASVLRGSTLSRPIHERWGALGQRDL